MTNSKNSAQSMVVAIDDDENILKFYVEALQDICNLEIFDNPKIGLEFISNNSIAAAIIDRKFPKFPELSGDDLCRELRQHSKTKNLPIIIVSGIDEIEDITKMMRKNKIDTYITKPILDLERLRTQVNYYITQKQNQE